ncbi:hypothetical protein [Vibrio sp. 10N]|uniref:hypothetical protein n=1 Tax=Vibrio sp. 10N TaxID=3058938 RepID=UPI002812E3BE|nr:hypothetical protein VB10N_19200 [Vibrio sp. 10N]
MPSFEPGYYRNTLTHLEDERENTSYSKSNFEEHWETLRTQWNDAAGRTVDTRTMIPLVDAYSEKLIKSKKYNETIQQCAEQFDNLTRLLVDASHHHEQYNRLIAEVNSQSEERDRTLRGSENTVKQAEQQQVEVDEIKRSADSHVPLI